MAGNRRNKLLNDPIHGYITLDPEILTIIDTPQFQRLRDLKQLGSCYLVFPGASHNRFEHSIGVSYLAGAMLSHLRQQQPELNITDRDIFLVRAAGLCHDLGHGPFSHVFDNEFIPKACPDAKWSHEEGSTMMLNALLDDNNGEVARKINITEKERKALFELINPYQHSTRQFPEKAFLYDIVANSRNSVDVDKFDYLARDCQNIGMKSRFAQCTNDLCEQACCSYDPQRLMKNCRVIKNEICFHKKEVYNVYEMFHTRYSLFRQVYTHRVSKALEYMITDVLLLADPVLKISSMIRDPKGYCNLTDCILKQIETSTDPKLAAARALIHRIRRRKLYKIVSETLIPPDYTKLFPEVREEQLAAVSGGRLKASDIVVTNLKLTYAMQDKNPVDSVRFFDGWDANESFTIPRHKVSYLIPQHFQERYLRVYLKDTTPEKMQIAKECVQKFLRLNQCASPAPTALSGLKLPLHASSLPASAVKGSIPASAIKSASSSSSSSAASPLTSADRANSATLTFAFDSAEASTRDETTVSTTKIIIERVADGKDADGDHSMADESEDSREDRLNALAASTRYPTDDEDEDFIQCSPTDSAFQLPYSDSSSISLSQHRDSSAASSSAGSSSAPSSPENAIKAGSSRQQYLSPASLAGALPRSMLMRPPPAAFAAPASARHVKPNAAKQKASKAAAEEEPTEHPDDSRMRDEAQDDEDAEMTGANGSSSASRRASSSSSNSAQRASLSPSPSAGNRKRKRDSSAGEDAANSNVSSASTEESPAKPAKQARVSASPASASKAKANGSAGSARSPSPNSQQAQQTSRGKPKASVALQPAFDATSPLAHTQPSASSSTAASAATSKSKASKQSSLASFGIGKSNGAAKKAESSNGRASASGGDDSDDEMLTQRDKPDKSAASSAAKGKGKQPSSGANGKRSGGKQPQTAKASRAAAASPAGTKSAPVVLDDDIVED